MIHSQLKHDNVVELYEYTENPEEIVLLMEYCNDANYFEHKIEEVIFSTSCQIPLESDTNNELAKTIILCK